MPEADQLSLFPPPRPRRPRWRLSDATAEAVRRAGTEHCLRLMRAQGVPEASIAEVRAILDEKPGRRI